jgi:hypothetical protein
VFISESTKVEARKTQERSCRVCTRHTVGCTPDRPREQNALLGHEADGAAPHLPQGDVRKVDVIDGNGPRAELREPEYRRRQRALARALPIQPMIL